MQKVSRPVTGYPKMIGKYYVGDDFNTEMLNVMDLIDQQGYVDSLRDMMRGVTLKDTQTCNIAKALVAKKSLITDMTGLGKSLQGVGFIYACLRKNPGTKAILFCTKDKISDFARVIHENTKMSACSFSGEKDRFAKQLKKIQPRLDKLDVFIFETGSVGKSFRIAQFIEFILKDINCIVIDESQDLQDMQSLRGKIFTSYLRRVEYALALNAQPLESKVEGMFNQLNHLVDNMMPEFKGVSYQYGEWVTVKPGLPKKLSGWRNLGEFTDKLKYRTFGFAREAKVTENQIVIRCKQTPEQEYLCATKGVLNSILYSPETNKEIKEAGIRPTPFQIPALHALITLLKSQSAKHDRIILFVNNTAIVPVIAKYIQDETDFVPIALTGSITDPFERDFIVRDFNRKHAVLISTIYTAFEADTDGTILYGLPNKTQQALGRNVRQFDEREVTQWVIVYPEMQRDIIYRKYKAEDAANQGLKDRNFSFYKKLWHTLYGG